MTTSTTSPLFCLRTLCLRLAPLLLLLPGCSDDPAPPPPQGLQDPADFTLKQTEQLATVYCTFATTCATSVAVTSQWGVNTRYASMESCLEAWPFVYPQLTDTLGTIERSEGAGRLEVDLDQATACLEETERVAELETCDEFIPALRELGDFPACRTLATGRVSLGGQCANSYECASSASGITRVCAALACAAGGGQGTCIEPQGGECGRCEADEFCNVSRGACELFVAPFARCGPESVCAQGARCSAFGQCYPIQTLAIGQPCAALGQCAVNAFCSVRDVCEPLVFNGPNRPCTTEYRLGAGLCQPGYFCQTEAGETAGLCKALLAGDGECTSSAQCQAGLACVGVTQDRPGTCTSPLGDGASCSPLGDANQCASARCGASTQTCIRGLDPCN